MFVYVLDNHVGSSQVFGVSLARVTARESGRYVDRGMRESIDLLRPRSKRYIGDSVEIGNIVNNFAPA